jgi:hypothetical protein
MQNATLGRSVVIIAVIFSARQPMELRAAEPPAGSTMRTVAISGSPSPYSGTRDQTGPSRSRKTVQTIPTVGPSTSQPTSLTFVAPATAEPLDISQNQPAVRQVGFLAESPQSTDTHEAPFLRPSVPQQVAHVAAESLNSYASVAARTAPSTDLNAGAPGPRTAAALRSLGNARAPVSHGQATPLPNASHQAQQVLDRFGSDSAHATLSQMPHRTPIRPMDTPVRRPAKPFQALSQEPTVSPYLNLHRAENDEEGAPNYFTFVRPQVDQLEATRRQQAEILRMQRQMQSNSQTSSVGGYRDVALPNSGVPARYRDTAQFYSAWQR